MSSRVERKPVFKLDDVFPILGIARGYAEGKKRPTVQIFRVRDATGRDVEIFAKRDALGRATVQIRDPNVTRRSPKVVAKDVAFKACMVALDEIVKSKAEGGSGSGLDYETLAEIRGKCMKEIYNKNKNNLLSDVEDRMKREDWKSIINSLSELYKGEAKSILESLINEAGGKITT